MRKLLYMHVLCLTCWTSRWDAAGWNSYQEFPDGFSIRSVDDGMLFQIGHYSHLFPVLNVCILSPCTVCSSSLSTRVTHYFVSRTSESPCAKHLCASHRFLLMPPAVTSSLSLWFYDRCHLDTRCRFPISAINLLRHHELSPSLSAYHWK